MNSAHDLLGGLVVGSGAGFDIMVLCGVGSGGVVVGAVLSELGPGCCGFCLGLGLGPIKFLRDPLSILCASKAWV